MRIVASLVALVFLAVVWTAGAARPPTVRPISVPKSALVGTAWHATVAISSSRAATLEARGPSTVRARLTPTKKRGVFAATLIYPRPGTWTLSAVIGARRTSLGAVRVDVQRDPLLRDPYTIAAEPGGALVVGQLREGAVVRIVSGHATKIVDDLGVFHISVAGGKPYVAARDGAVYRLDESSLTRVSPLMDASSVAVDSQGNLYVTIYAGWIKRVGLDGSVTTIAGDGTEGLTGDGGPAVSAKLFHPHAVVIGRDGALYVADTENRRIRRIDLVTGSITTFGGNVGVTTSLAIGPDGSIFSSDVVRDGAGGGVTRTTPAGTTTRILSHPDISSVAVAQDGTVFANAWESKRILRLDPLTRGIETVARG